MTVCKFFQQGYCRYGEKCRYEHTRGGASQYTWVKPNYNSNNRFGALASKGFPGNGDSSEEVVLSTVAQDMNEWIHSGMWPLSCYGMKDSGHCVQGFEDASPEELEWEYRNLRRFNGDARELTRKISETIRLYGDQKQKLKSPDVSSRAAIYAEVTKKYDGTSGSTGNIMQNLLTGDSKYPIQNAFCGGPHPNGFGPAAERPPPASNPFGGPPQSEAFGGDNGNLFGKSQPAALFGKSICSSSSVFGNGASGGTSVFTNSQTLGTGLFGKNPAPSSSLFGQCGTGASTMSGGTTQGLFGKPAESGSRLFGMPNSPQGPLFGMGSSSSSNPGLFGTGATRDAAQNSLFACPIPPGGGLFGKAPAVGEASSGGVSQQVNAQDRTEGLFTPMDQLSKEEKEQFSAPTFSLGKVPIRPPPKEMVT